MINKNYFNDYFKNIVENIGNDYKIEGDKLYVKIGDKEHFISNVDEKTKKAINILRDSKIFESIKTVELNSNQHKKEINEIKNNYKIFIAELHKTLNNALLQKQNTPKNKFINFIFKLFNHTDPNNLLIEKISSTIKKLETLHGKIIEKETAGREEAIKHESANSRTNEKPSSSLFELNEPNEHQKKAMVKIKYNLGIALSDEESNMIKEIKDLSSNEEYQRKLVLGFGVGRKNAVKKFRKLGGLEIDKRTLGKLTGGHGTDNMYYLACFLEQKITAAKKDNSDSQYINKLKKLESNIKRSLKFAFQKKFIDHTETKGIDTRPATLKENIIYELCDMKPGQSLFIPIESYKPRHAMMLSLEKNENGLVVPKFFNTGYGVEQKFGTFDLFSQGGATSLKFSPVDPLDLNFGGMLEKMLGNVKKKGSVQDLYENLKTLGKPEKEWGKEQINGICSFQSLYAVVKDNLQPSKEERKVQEKSKQSEVVRQFKDDFLTYIKDDFKKIYKDVVKNASREQATKEDKWNLELHKAMLKDLDSEIKSNKNKLDQLNMA